MISLPEKLQKWSVEELNFVSETGFHQIPDVDSFKSLTQGKYKKVWNYVINHVRSKSSVQKVKRILSLKKYREDLQVNGANCDQEFSINKLQASVIEAEEKRQFLKKKISAVEENVLLLHENIDKISKEKHFVLQKTAILQLLRGIYSDKTVWVKNLDIELKEHKDNILAYQSSSKLSMQSDLTFSYSFLCADKSYNVDSCLMDEICNVALSVLKSRLSSEMIDSALLNTFHGYYRELQSKGFLLTDLLYYLNNKSNSHYQKLAKKMKDYVSVSDFRTKSQDIEYIKHLMCKLKYENVQHSLFTLKSKNKIENLQTTLNKEMKETQKNECIDADLDSKYALVKVLAENVALTLVNSSLEEHLEQISKKADLLAKESEDIHDWDLNLLIEQFHNNADMTFSLLYASSGANTKVLSIVKDLQLFLQDENFQSYPSADFTVGLKDLLLRDRKLMWDSCEKSNLIYPKTPDPYDIRYPLLPELRQVLPIELHENFVCVCGNLIDLKNELKVEAFNGSKAPAPVNISLSTIYERIRNSIEGMKNWIQESEVSLDEGMICCEKNRVLIQDWWEQKAQYILETVYDGKTLKMWIDILYALDDFDPICNKGRKTQ